MTEAHLGYADSPGEASTQGDFLKNAGDLEGAERWLTDDSFRERLGRCYELAARYAFDHGGTIVHGTIEAFGNPRIQHAWVELPGGRIYDAVAAQEFPKGDYEQLFDPRPEARFDPDEARIALLRNNHWGPWTSKTASSEIKCPKCKGIIPDDETPCPNCGWTPAQDAEQEVEQEPQQEAPEQAQQPIGDPNQSEQLSGPSTSDQPSEEAPASANYNDVSEGQETPDQHFPDEAYAPGSNYQGIDHNRRAGLGSAGKDQAVEPFELEKVRNWAWVEQESISPQTRQALIREGWTVAGDDLVSPGFRGRNEAPTQGSCMIALIFGLDYVIDLPQVLSFPEVLIAWTLRRRRHSIEIGVFNSAYLEQMPHQDFQPEFRSLIQRACKISPKRSCMTQN